MGLSLLAFLAGAQPNMIPTAVEKPTPNATAEAENTKSVSRSFAAANDKSIPRITPMIPPKRESTTDSSRN